MKKSLMFIISLFLLVAFLNCEKVIDGLVGGTEIKTFSYSPSTVILDTVSKTMYDIDSVIIDSVDVLAIFSDLDSFQIIINNVDMGKSIYSDTLKVKVPLTLLFSSTGTLGAHEFSAIFLSSSGDTIANETIAIYVQSEFIDPYFRYCWHLDDYDTDFHSSYNINRNAGISILEAWDISKGNGVLVAVIDDNFEVLHEDLSSNIQETYNVDNGSADVSNNTAYISHGSTCASFIASPKNKIGVIGVAPEAKLLLISESSGYDNGLVKAFDYAKQKGAQVISCSWGSYDVSEALSTKIKEMYDAGITVIFANGNDRYNLDSPIYNDESELDWVIGVGASAEDNDYTSYTNYGSKIEVIAPGGDDIGVLGVDESGSNGGNETLGIVNNNYSFVFGTSFSAPITAGVVALMLSVDPTLTPDQVRSILIETADKVGENASYENGFDKFRAYGKVNAEKAVKRAAGLM